MFKDVQGYMFMSGLVFFTWKRISLPRIVNLLVIVLGDSFLL